MSAEPQILTVPILGVPTRAWCYGEPEGAPFILVHGFRGDHHGLDGLARGLVGALSGVRVVVPDLPGFGQTPAVAGREHTPELYGEWLRAFAASVAAREFTVLGHSFGSLVVGAAIADGLDPRRVILINPISAPALSGPNSATTGLAVAYYRVAAALPERAARRLLGNPLIVRAMSEVMATTREPRLRRWIHGQHAQHFSRFSDPTTLLQAFRGSVSRTMPEYAEALQSRPTLLIAGDRDDISPLHTQLALQHRITGAQLRVVPGVGHLVHYEAVDDSVEFIKKFLVNTKNSPSVKSASTAGPPTAAGAPSGGEELEA